jgi:hypothetical protein
MSFNANSRLRCAGWLALLVFAIATAGCQRSQSANQAMMAALQQTGQSKVDVVPLAGTVTIDGQPPKIEGREAVIVMLFDTTKPDLKLNQRPYVECDDAGKFAFSTYEKGDGLKPGTYVVAIAELSETKPRRWLGPDRLENLYNDPDTNAANPDFKIEHGPPGKKDHEFRLTRAGAVPVENPGPHAVTAIP